jgi:hypothetical protein
MCQHIEPREDSTAEKYHREEENRGADDGLHTEIGGGCSIRTVRC